MGGGGIKRKKAFFTFYASTAHPFVHPCFDFGAD